MNIQSILTARVLLNIRQAAHVNPANTGPELSTIAFEMRPQTTVEGEGVGVPSGDGHRFENNE
jgi:hypothetical protein